MIPNVTRGSNPVGLVSYLAGPGRANEHESPHLVAGSARIMAWYSTDNLSHDDALAIGSELEQPHRVMGVEMDRHVWHCSLSLHEADGVRSDQEWEQIAHDFMEQMGFIGVEGKADVPWVALRHGVSGTNGNDHIHLAVTLIREDGTKADTWRDFPRTQSVSRELEKKYGLMEVKAGHGAPGITAQELNASLARGRTEAERSTLARLLRGYVVESASEDEFVRRMRAGGLLVRPRFESGSMEKVVGFAVALKPPAGHQPVFYAASKVARDLGLRVIRDGWPEGQESSPAAVAEWQAARFGKRAVVAGGPETLTPDVESMERTAQQLAQYREQLRAVPLSDHEQYRRAAAFVSGAYASWSRQVEPVPGELAAVADELAKSGQVSRSAYQRSAGPMGLRSSVALAFAASRGGVSGDLAVFVQLSKLARTIHDFNKARGDGVREFSMRRVAAGELVTVSNRLHDAAGVARPQAVRGAGPRQSARRQGPVVSPVVSSKKRSGQRAGL